LKPSPNIFPSGCQRR